MILHRRKGAPTRSAAPEAPTKGHHKTAPGRRPISGRSGQALLLWFKSRKTAQVGRFSESRPDALASFKLSSWPVYGPLVVPRSVLPPFQVGLVDSPASLQSSASIILGIEGLQSPRPKIRRGAGGPKSPRPATFLTPLAKTGRPLADRGRRIENVRGLRPGWHAFQSGPEDCTVAGRLDRPADIGFNSGVGCLGRGEPPSPPAPLPKRARGARRPHPNPLPEGEGTFGRRQESGVGYGLRGTRHPARKVSLASSRPDNEKPSVAMSYGGLSFLRLWCRLAFALRLRYGWKDSSGLPERGLRSKGRPRRGNSARHGPSCSGCG